MANKIFLQTILKFRDQIKEGSAKFADVIEDYVRTSGKTPTEEERAILIKEYYGYSNAKAKIALDILDKKQLNLIKEKLDKGGRKKWVMNLKPKMKL